MTYIIEMDNNHQEMIKESLELTICVLNFNFNTVVNFIINETHDGWINDVLPDHIPTQIQNEIDAIIKPNFDLMKKNIESIIGKLNQTEFEENEISIIINSLDLSSRVLCGQILEIGRMFNFCYSEFNVDVLDGILNKIKELIFINLSPHASYGIYNINTPLKPRICYEIIQVLRHELWNNMKNKIKYVVSAYPVHHETNYPLIKIYKKVVK